MRQYKYFFFACLFLIGLSSFGQKWEIKVGQSTTNKLTREKPAHIISTFPKNDTISNSTLIDAFFELKYKVDSKFSFDFFYEMHKNNLVEKEQDVSQLGLGLNFRIDDVKIFGRKMKIYNNFNFRESRDDVKKTSTSQLVYGVSFNLREKRDNIFDYLRSNTVMIAEGENKILTKFINFDHDHSVGFGYLNGKDNVVIRNLSFEMNVYPFSTLFYGVKKNIEEKKDKFVSLKKEYDDALIEYNSKRDTLNFVKKEAKLRLLDTEKDRIEKEAGRFRNLLVVNWIIKDRNAILGRTEEDLGTFSKISIGLNYNLAENSAFGLVYSWQRGADIYTGLENQDFNTLAATFKLGL